MARKLSIEFFEAKKPINELATKFGGQPHWLGEPQWPLSKATGEPMRFIGQIAIAPEIFGQVSARMAYLFMTDDEKVDGTWDPDGGENALILQPGETSIRTEPLTNGPTLFRMGKRFFGAMNWPKTLEFGVRLTTGEDSVPRTDDAGRKISEEEFDSALQALSGNKVGGTPMFLQGDEFPAGGPWNLLLQLDSAALPFFVNFGDAGVGYAFISQDGKQGKFLWQCC
jgi:uncharacterized protein YwqG